MVKLLRISTVPHSLHLLLKGQLKYMSEQGIEVSVACSYGEEVDELGRREAVKYYPIALNRSLNPFKDLIPLFQLIRLIIKLKPDIVHTHSPKAGIIGMLAAKICKVPLKIHTVAGLPLMEQTGIKRRILILVEKITYYLADWVLPNSEKQMQYIKAHIYSGNNVTIIGKGSSNGIDLEYFKKRGQNYTERAELRKSYNILDTDIVLTFVGRLANYKGINELVESFKILSDKYPHIKLFLVGPFEDLNPLRPETVHEIETNHSIIATGHQNDIRPFLNLSDIFVFPSYREGFPQSLMQASAYELPCIASDINGCNEIVFDGFNGYLIPSKNIDALVKACGILIEDKDKRTSFGNNGREHLLLHFEQKQFWEKLYNFYLEKLKAEERRSFD